MTKVVDTRIRELAIANYKKYGSIKNTCEDFNISKATLFRWINLQKEGSLTPKKRGGKRKGKIVAKQLNIAMEGADKVFISQAELAKKLGVSQSTISRFLKRKAWLVTLRDKRISKYNSTLKNK